jgi:hypothetical protein
VLALKLLSEVAGFVPGLEEGALPFARRRKRSGNLNLPAVLGLRKRKCGLSGHRNIDDDSSPAGIASIEFRKIE